MLRARALEQALRMLIDAAVQTACKIAEDGDRRWHVVDLVCATNDAEKLLAVDPPPSGVSPQSDELGQALVNFMVDLEAAQVELPPEVATVLRENRWDLYEGSPVIPASPQAEELRAANVANLREMVVMAGRHRETLLAVRECILALSPGHRTGYDWNADPLYMTRYVGDALKAIDAGLKSLNGQAAVPTYRHVYIVTHYPDGGLRGVHDSQAGAEAEIAELCREYPDYTRQDFSIVCDRIRPSPPSGASPQAETSASFKPRGREERCPSCDCRMTHSLDCAPVSPVEPEPPCVDGMETVGPDGVTRMFHPVESEPCVWRDKGNGVLTPSCKRDAKPMNRAVADGFGLTKCGHYGAPLKVERKS